MLLVPNSYSQIYKKSSSVIFHPDIEQSLRQNFNHKPQFKKSHNWVYNDKIVNLVAIIVEKKEIVKPKKKFKSKHQCKTNSQNFEAFSPFSKSRTGSLIQQLKHPIQLQKYIKIVNAKVDATVQSVPVLSSIGYVQKIVSARENLSNAQTKKMMNEIYLQNFIYQILFKKIFRCCNYILIKQKFYLIFQCYLQLAISLTKLTSIIIHIKKTIIHLNYSYPSQIDMILSENTKNKFITSMKVMMDYINNPDNYCSVFFRRVPKIVEYVSQHVIKFFHISPSILTSMIYIFIINRNTTLYIYPSVYCDLLPYSFYVSSFMFNTIQLLNPFSMSQVVNNNVQAAHYFQ